MNTQLINPLFSRYRQGETVQYLKRLFEIFPAGTATILNVHPEWLALNTVYLELFSKWQPEKGSELTPEIAALDAKRDALFVAFKKTVDAWAVYHYNSSINNSAKVVSHNIASHGNRIHKMNYEQQSATLDAIINDCEGVHSAHIATMGVGEWIDELKSVNEAFGDKYVERLGDYFTAEPGIIAQLLTDALNYYADLAASFEARWRIAVLDSDTSEATFTQTGQMWNVLTDEFNLIIRRRSGGSDLPPPPPGE